MSNAGWYPDPGGAPGMYRYWDGTQWSSALTAGPGPGSPAASGWNRSPGEPLASSTARPHPFSTVSPTAGLRGLVWWVLILAVVLGLVFGGYTLLRTVGALPGGTPAGSNATPDPCPTSSPTGPALSPQITADGRVQGGKLSYPLLGAPWSSPSVENRVAFGRGAFTQNVVTEPLYSGTYSWVASVLVAELVAGDGFFSPQAGADLVAKCAMGSFYSDAVVTRDDKVSKAVTIDGKDGWVLETHLSFDIRGLKVKGETAIFVIVATSTESSSLFYASIPDDHPELLVTARQVQAALRVEP